MRFINNHGFDRHTNRVDFEVDQWFNRHSAARDTEGTHVFQDLYVGFFNVVNTDRLCMDGLLAPNLCHNAERFYLNPMLVPFVKGDRAINESLVRNKKFRLLRRIARYERCKIFAMWMLNCQAVP